MKKRFINLLCFLMLFVLVIAQETSQTTMNVTLQEARDYAIRNNRSMQNASLEVRKAHAQRWQTIASMLPQADMSLNLQHVNGTMKFSMEGMQMNQEMKNTTGSLSVSASMAINGQMIVGALLNNLAIEMQNINYKSTELDVVSNVETFYITALAMQKTVNLLDSTLIRMEDLYESTSKAVEAGAVEQTNADQLMVQIASVKSSIKATKRSLDLIYNSLALQMAVGSDVKLVLTDNLDELLNVEDAVALLESDFNINSNYSYQLAQKNVELEKKNVIMAGMAYVPTISAFYQYSSPNKYFSGSSPMEQQMGVVGATLSIPLWSSGKRAAAITEKKLAVMSAQNSLADAEDGLKLQHRQLKSDLSSAYENFDVQKLNIEVSQRVFNNTSEKFKYGYASSVELTNASMTLLTAQSDYIQSILTLVNAQIELKKLLNK